MDLIVLQIRILTDLDLYMLKYTVKQRQIQEKKKSANVKILAGVIASNVLLKKIDKT